MCCSAELNPALQCTHCVQAMHLLVNLRTGHIADAFLLPSQLHPDCLWVMSQKAPANCQKWLQLGRDRGDKNNHVPLWKRPICTPGCAFGNYFRLCDVNTANTVVWFNHTTEPHRHAVRAPRTFCTRSHHLCTCAPRCPKCNRLSDSLGSGLVQVSRSWKGAPANWKEALIAPESRTRWYSLVTMCKTLKWNM